MAFRPRHNKFIHIYSQHNQNAEDYGIWKVTIAMSFPFAICVGELHKIILELSSIAKHTLYFERATDIKHVERTVIYTEDINYTKYDCSKATAYSSDDAVDKVYNAILQNMNVKIKRTAVDYNMNKIEIRSVSMEEIEEELREIALRKIHKYLSEEEVESPNNQ